MSLFCANNHCQLPPLSSTDARVDIKAVLPANWPGIKDSCVRWKRNGEAAFHVGCWSAVLKLTRSRFSTRKGSSRGRGDRGGALPAIKQAEKLMIVNAAKTLEKFDSLEDIKAAAKKAANVIQNAHHCIAFTGAGISTSAGLGDFRGKSGKWTEEDQTAVEGAIQAAVQMDASAPGSSSAEDSTPGTRKRVPTAESRGHGDVNPESPAKKRKSNVKDDNGKERETCSNKVDEDNEEAEETVDYENLRPTYTHEALAMLMERGLLHYVVSQNCDGLHLLSGIPLSCISELHGNVFVEKCPRCEKRYPRNFYVLHDEASRYYEEMEEDGETEVKKPRFAVQCDLCGLCHRTGRRCEEKGCGAYLEDTIINFRDHLEDVGLDRALEESGKSDVVLCLGTTLKVTPACDIVEEANGKKPLIICNRQKTDKDQLAGIRVFGDCDVFMAEVLVHLLDKEDKSQWEEKRAERMKTYNLKRQNVPSSAK